ncbi:MAG: hypothetical protein II145_03415 [Selenomonas sp.]|nr:hypothetical protein [Selenomonas sp.]
MKEDLIDISKSVQKELYKTEKMSLMEMKLRALNARINNEIKPIIIVMVTISVGFFSMAYHGQTDIAWLLALVLYIALACGVARIIRQNIITIWCEEWLNGDDTCVRREVKGELYKLKKENSFNYRQDRQTVLFIDIMFIVSFFFCILTIFLYICDIGMMQFLWSLLSVIVMFIHWLVVSHPDNFFFLIASCFYIAIYLLLLRR